LAELSQTDEFQPPSSFHEQLYLTVDYMCTDGLTIPCSKIAIIFGLSKRTIVQHYGQLFAQRQKGWLALSIELDT
jgi:hypothetical protein